MVNTEMKKEQQYLRQVYEELSQTRILLEALLEKTQTEGHNTLQSLAGEVSLNFDSMLDNLDTFSMLEMKNREIDQLNIRMQTAKAELEKVRRLLERPYFGKVTADFMEPGESPEEDLYIGINGFTNEAGDNRIYDWRSPVAELFYNNELGLSNYMVGSREVPVNILNRRQLIVEKNQLLNYFDTSVAVQDEVLLGVLESDASNQMKDITATIQKEQNRIIRDRKSPALLVNGVAGSGKTSTIMQRVAYLLFSLRREITEDNILILSPNDRFIDYISSVLPALGEKNPANLTMLQFVQQYLSEDLEDETQYFERISQVVLDEQSATLRSREFLTFIEGADSLLLKQGPVFREIRQKGKTIISKETLQKLYDTTPEHAHFRDKMQAMKARLSSWWQRRILTQAKDSDTQNQILSLSENLQEKYFGELIQDDSEASILRYGQKLLKRKYRSVTRAIRQLDWLDQEAILRTLYETFSGQKYQRTKATKMLDDGVVELYIRHQLIEKISVPKLRFLLIDEVQDYSEAQLSLLLTLFPQTEYTLVGDENQAIFNSRTSFEGIGKLFAEKHIPVTRYDLQNSYRSSGAITKVFQQLVPADADFNIVAVRPDGIPVEFFGFQNRQEYFIWLSGYCERLQNETLTIITKNSERAAALQQQLEEETELLEKFPVEIFPVSLAKGLEFDHVLIHDASKENYYSERALRLLYTAVSRGMQSLAVSYQGEISIFLKK